MYPGPTQFTVTPSPPSSAASDSFEAGDGVLGRDVRVQILAAHRTHDRADVDDATVASLLHGAAALAHQYERPAQVGGDHAVKVVGRKVADLVPPIDSGVVHEDADPPVLLDDAPHRRLARGFGRDGEGDTLAARAGARIDEPLLRDRDAFGRRAGENDVAPLSARLAPRVAMPRAAPVTMVTFPSSLKLIAHAAAARCSARRRTGSRRPRRRGQGGAACFVQGGSRSLSAPPRRLEARRTKTRRRPRAASHSWCPRRPQGCSSSRSRSPASRPSTPRCPRARPARRRRRGRQGGRGRGRELTHR